MVVSEGPFPGYRIEPDHFTTVSSLAEDSEFPEDQNYLVGPSNTTLCLYGRDEEQKILQDAYERVSRGSSEVCFVSGASGSGKSALVESLRDVVAGEGRGYFISGKYDHLHQIPYSGIVAAFTDLVDLINQSGRLQRFYAYLEHLVGSDMPILTALLSNLPLPNRTRKQQVEQPSMEQAFTRLKRLCRFFLQAASSPEHPILMLLDDLQWCDESSLAVLRALMTDVESKHVLIVGTYRDGHQGVCCDDLVGTFSSDSPSLQLTWIKLTSLDQEAIISLVDGMTNGGLECRNELACILNSKTGGNPYFLMRFLEMLQDNQLLKRSGDGQTWICEVERIQNETQVSDNLADMVSSRLQKLQHDVLELLKLASALGYWLDVDVLYTVAVSEQVIPATAGGEGRILRMLDSAVSHGFLERGKGEHLFKFSHDRIQSCLYSCFESDEQRDALHLRIGKILWEMSEAASDDEKLIFYAAEQWNRSSQAIQDATDLDTLIAINFKTGQMAISRSAFGPACEYFAKAINSTNRQLLWTTHFAFAVDLFSSYAEALNSKGEYIACMDVCNEILSRTVLMKDQLRAFWALATALSGQNRNQEGIDIGFLVLRKLGVRIPRRPTLAHAAVEIIKTRKGIGFKNYEDLLNLPLMTDWRKIAAMKMMSKITLLMYMSYAEKNGFAILGLRMMQLSCKYGLTSMSPYGFANYALVHALVGRYDEANRMGQLAMRVTERLRARDSEARTVAILNHFVFHWRVPLPSGLAEFRRSYLLGFQTGDLEFSYGAAIGVLTFSMFQITSLRDLEAEARDLCRVLDDFPHRTAAHVIRSFHQVIHNMLGWCDCVTEFTGEALNEAQWEEEIRSEDNPMLMFQMGFLKVQNGLMFDAPERMLEGLSTVDVEEIALRGTFMQYVSKWACGMAHISLYKSTGRRHHKRRALKHYRALRKWSLKEGVRNCDPFYYLLDAECLSLTNLDAARLVYDKAIALGVERNSPMYQAMASESAGRAFLFFGNDHATAHSYLTFSLDHWQQLESSPKVDQLSRLLGKCAMDTTSLLHMSSRQLECDTLFIDVSAKPPRWDDT